MKKESNNKTEFATFRMTKEMKKAILDHKRVSELSEDAILRVAIREYLAKLGYNV